MTRPLSYQLVRFKPPHDLRSAAEVQCKCGVTEKLIITGMGNNPEKIVKGFIRLGWEMDQHNAAKCLCPKCIRHRAIRVAAEREEKIVTSVATRIPGLRDAQVANPIPVARPSSPVEVEVSIKSLSSEQKASLRQYIEGHFDEKLGRWLENHSDHTCSELLGIPRVIVVDFRENFYGEIKDDPEISAFRLQIKNARDVITNLSASVDKMEEKLNRIAAKNGL